MNSAFHADVRKASRYVTISENSKVTNQKLMWQKGPINLDFSKMKNFKDGCNSTDIKMSQILSFSFRKSLLHIWSNNKLMIWQMGGATLAILPIFNKCFVP